MGYKQSAQIVFEQYQLARNMTEMMGALTALVHSQRTDIEAEREEILDHFYRHFKDDRLVVQKWLRLQSTASNERILETMEKLMVHECYDSGNPNFIYSLIG